MFMYQLFVYNLEEPKWSNETYENQTGGQIVTNSYQDIHTTLYSKISWALFEKRQQP